MDSIKKIVMTRDNMSEFDFDNLWEDAMDEARQAETLDDLDRIVEDYFGLEPDYVIELLNELGGLF